MKLNYLSSNVRKSFFALVVSLTVCPGMAAKPPEPPPEVAKLSIMQGATSDTTTQVSLVAPADAQYTVTLSDGVDEYRPSRHENKNPYRSVWSVHRLQFEGLTKGRSYTLTVRSVDDRVIDSRTLKTLDPQKTDVLLALASSMDDRMVAAGTDMWADLVSRVPDMIFFLGDNVYADTMGASTTPGGLWRRYVETRNALPIFKMEQLIPIVATWNDHDYGVNAGTALFPYKNESAEIFETFYAQSPVAGLIQKGPGVSTLLTAFGQKFFFMDNRSFRGTVNQDGFVSHWGTLQENWLSAQLNFSSAPAWVINGDQLFGGYHAQESFEREHSDAFGMYKSSLREADVPVVMVSGDVRYSEIMRIPQSELGYATLEITCSSMHAEKYTSAGQIPANTRRAFGPYIDHNFMLIRSRAARDLNLDVSVIGPNKQLVYRQRYTVAK